MYGQVANERGRESLKSTTMPVKYNKYKHRLQPAANASGSAIRHTLRCPPCALPSWHAPHHDGKKGGKKKSAMQWTGRK